MRKRVYIIHGWGGMPGEHWMPWLRRELEAQRFNVIEPSMPDTDNPVIEKWVGHLTEIIEDPDEQTYFVGHSVGCQAIMRYLETIPGKKVGGCVFVAGWFRLENLDEEEALIAPPWMRDDINFTKVLSTTRNFVVLNSSNDDFGAVAENKKLFEKKLGATVTVLENRGHFTESDGVTELPEVIAVLRQWS